MARRAGSPDARPHEKALRVVGRWMDEQRPKDVFLFEQDGQYVVRLLVATQGGAHHEISEFTREDVDILVANGPDLRGKAKPTAAPIVAAAALSAVAADPGNAPGPRGRTRRRPGGARAGRSCRGRALGLGDSPS